MTNIFGIVDPDPDRRAGMVSRVSSELEQSSGTSGTWKMKELSIVATSGRTTPFNSHEFGSYWGWECGTLPSDGGIPPVASALRKAAAGAPVSINGLNGYYVACCLAPSGTLTLGTDVLGFFPLYYWGDHEVFIFSSSPRLIRMHPRVASRLSLHGLAGILLQGHEANGQSIWEGIRRPAPGHAVRWVPGSGVSCHEDNPLVPTEEHFGLEYEQARRLINQTLRNSVIRTAGEAKDGIGVMLSGGMDSRLVAGHLHATLPNRATAVIFGDPSDIEVGCATAVAKTLGMPVKRIPIRFPEFSTLAAKCVEREQLSNTLMDYGWLSGMVAQGALDFPLLSGFYGDPVMGGSIIPWAFDPKRGSYLFDPLLARANVYGFKPAEIERMVSIAPMGKVVAQVIEEMRSRFEALPGHPFQKSWQWGLYNRVKYHVAPYAWRLASYAWPLAPYTDREMLQVAAGMPLDYLSYRRMQYDTLKKEFPRLARLPLDRNSFDTTPLLPSRLDPWKSRIMRRLAPLISGGGERRAYYRIFEINNPGWRLVREVAEVHRSAVHGVIKPEELARWVPAPAEFISAGDQIIDTANRKTLLALMLLAGQDAEVLNAGNDR